MCDHQTDIIVELGDLLVDWDGTDIPDASLPRIDVLCGTIRRAISEIERLRRVVVERNEQVLTAERQVSAKNRALAGLLNCDALMTGDPDHDAHVWADAESNARMALEIGTAERADATSNPPLSDLSSLRKGAEVVREALEDCAQWLEVILAEKVIVEPENEQHIAASIARARAALVSGSREDGE